MKIERLLTLVAAAAISACGTPLPAPEPRVEWVPSRITISPTADLTTRIETGRSKPATGKYSPRFYQKLRAQPAIASLAQVDIWELRHHPRQYDIITIGPVSLRQYSGRRELLDHLATTHGLTKEKAEVLTNWVKTGGILWSEFGVFVQGYEWVQSGDVRQLPPLPDLKGFTIMGMPTSSFVFEADRRGPFAIERKVYPFQNEARHTGTADIKALKLVQSDLAAIYPVISPDRGAALIQEGANVYASVVPFGQGRILSMLPFDQWDPETDGEKLRINLREWLAGYPVPVFEPLLEVERTRD
jgi:hypothetical protein